MTHYQRIAFGLWVIAFVLGAFGFFVFLRRDDMFGSVLWVLSLLGAMSLGAYGASFIV